MHIVEEIVVDHNFEGIEIGREQVVEQEITKEELCDKHGGCQSGHGQGRYVFKIEKQKLM